jgi:hypothetical protein
MGRILIWSHKFIKPFNNRLKLASALPKNLWPGS